MAMAFVLLCSFSPPQLSLAEELVGSSAGCNPFGGRSTNKNVLNISAD